MMKFRASLMVILILTITISVVYDNYYPKQAIIGKYVYNFSTAVAEGPNYGDRLTLKENGLFESDTWSKGTYGLKKGRLILNGNKGDFNTYFYRELFWGKPRIVIERDLNYYFEKLD